MKPGIYTVESWNNKDAVLINDSGEFLSITKNELSKECAGQLFIGEKIEVATVTIVKPQSGKSLDERSREARGFEVATQQQSQKQRDFVAAENERRMRYGAKPL